MIYPVGVQAAYDADNLYIRLTFKAETGGADKGDKDNEVKATMMFPDAKVTKAEEVGCWTACHDDARTMPGADEKKTKYTKEGTYELMQWRSAKGAKVANGTVRDSRKMEGEYLGRDGRGSRAGDTYTVTFTRRKPRRRQENSIWSCYSRGPRQRTFPPCVLGVHAGYWRGR